MLDMLFSQGENGNCQILCCGFFLIRKLKFEVGEKSSLAVSVSTDVQELGI